MKCKNNSQCHSNRAEQWLPGAGGKRGYKDQREQIFSYKMIKSGDLLHYLVTIMNNNVLYT